MNLAIMQPYLFPYLGYFQLINAADLFLIYDDVTYIKQSYINRNHIASNGEKFRFTIPVPGASSNRLISTLEYSDNVSKFLKNVSQCYSRAPFKHEAMYLVEAVITSKKRQISELCELSYSSIFQYLGVDISIEKTSTLDYSRDKSGSDRLIELCKKFRATRYINSPGGSKLYSKEHFRLNDIELKFIHMIPVRYEQGHAFIPNLSIIDVLMNCSPRDILHLLEQYTLQ